MPWVALAMMLSLSHWGLFEVDGDAYGDERMLAEIKDLRDEMRLLHKRVAGLETRSDKERHARIVTAASRRFD